MSDNRSRKRWKPVLVYFAASFILHLAWENAQMPLFTVSGISPWDSFKMCLFATATGDMLFMLTLLVTVAVVHRNLWWLSDRTAYSHPATWIVPVVIGTLLAVSFELWAVYVDDRWVYGSMPIIPVVKVGLTPVLQMILIPLAVNAVGRWFAPSRQ